MSSQRNSSLLATIAVVALTSTGIALPAATYTGQVSEVQVDGLGRVVSFRIGGDIITVNTPTGDLARQLQQWDTDNTVVTFVDADEDGKIDENEIIGP